jgi:uncharacterized repeat protein (TIGR04138 family)
MSNLQFADDVLERLREKNPRYQAEAYLFLLSALHTIMESLEQPRHISGPELVEGVRDLALERYGLLARTVLEHWGVHTTEDLGELVFALVDCGILTKEDRDTPADFCELFDFEDAFERDYPWDEAWSLLRDGGN